MAGVTKQQLIDAGTDAATLAEIVNGPATETVQTRLGQSVQTVAKAISQLTFFTPRGNWVTATAYALKDLVVSGTITYVATVAHVSAAAFATDLAAGRWAVYQGVTGLDIAAVSGTSFKANGATGGGAVDDTVNGQSVISAAAQEATIIVPTGTYLTGTGFVVASPALIQIEGVGKAVFKATAAVTLLKLQSDTSGLIGSRIVAGMRFDGNGVDSTAWRPGTVGLRIGDSANAIKAATSGIYAHNCETGLFHYASQQCTDRDAQFFRCRVGVRVENDPTAGGATAYQLNRSQSYLCDIGLFFNNMVAFNKTTTATLANGSTAVTNVADMTGITVGKTVAGRGIPPGATVAGGITSNSFTLSAATSATAAMSKVPITFGNAFQGYDTELTVDGGVYQGNYWAGIVSFGNHRLTIRDVHFEGNNVPIGSLNGTTTAGSPVVTAVAPINSLIGATVTSTAFPAGTTVLSRTANTLTLSNNATTGGAATLAFTPGPITISNRTVFALPHYHSNTYVLYDTCGVYESNQSVPVITAVDGSRIRFNNCGMPDCTILVGGDLTSTVTFTGHAEGLGGVCQVPVARWPDTVSLSRNFLAIGIATETRTKVIPNAYPGSALLPVFTALGAGAVISTFIDPIMGPVTKVVFSGTAGAYGTNSISTAFLDGTFAAGDQILESILVRSDGYTNLHATATGGSQAYLGDVPITPDWQRLVVGLGILGTGAGLTQVYWPVGTDAPTLYFCHMMQVRVRTGGDTDIISATLREGLFNDNSGGALKGTVTVDLASIAAAASGAEQTIAVPGARFGNRVTITCDQDSLGLTLDGRVQAADVVKFIPRNVTAAAVDLPNATFTAWVIP